MGQKLRVLLLEDSKADAFLLKRELVSEWSEVEIFRVFAAEAMKKALQEDTWDIVISDFNMPQFSGLEALKILKRSGCNLPFIMVSGKAGEEVATSVMRAGAQDYILKDNIERLPLAIKRELEEWNTRREKVETERALQQSEKLWTKTIAAIPDSVILLDKETRIIKYNPAAEKIFHIQPGELSGMYCDDVLQKDKQQNSSLFCKTIINSGKRKTEEVLVENHWYLLSVDPVFDEEGDLSHIVHIMKDIHQRKLAELDLRQAHSELQEMHKNLEIKVAETVEELRQKDRFILQQSRQAAIGEMISQIAHHWRQPLNEIGLCIQAIGEAFEFDELSEEYLDQKIEQAMKVLNELSRSIIEFGDLFGQGEEEKEFDIEKSIRKTVSVLKDRFVKIPVQVVFNCECDLKIKCLPNEFNQAVINILINAFEVMDRRNISEPKVWIDCYRNTKYTTISIRDNGGGIAPEVKDNLFELYSTTKKSLNNKGTGLYFSRVFIEKNMNGKIELINHEAGAEFQIKI